MAIAPSEESEAQMAARSWPSKVPWQGMFLGRASLA